MKKNIIAVIWAFATIACVLCSTKIIPVEYWILFVVLFIRFRLGKDREWDK